ncbi:alpha/beta fold hydrolase [Rugosimonospora africana]|uniref:Putative hydrolase YraK n=1 Tax=Rugosimonospora africana TaxID=556532 RepID=A0A8J3QR00_9ACTN|nr:alpha/beta hydrolase [Rugosimonospora africana]GIH14941.1 putative hydrolase YraK [Rugosimonospora africana]
MATRRCDTLDVSGARLYYEVRGSGPTLLLIPGSNGDAGFYAALADRLAERYTVISYDRRGFSRSPISRQGSVAWADAHTEDARQLLDAVAAGPAHVFGSSAGAVIGLDLISRHPQQVATLIAHEPPLAELLPDAARWRTFFQDVSTMYHTEGAGPAMQKFMTGIGMDAAERPPHVDPEVIGRMSGNVHTILTQEVPNAPSYNPDLAALDAQQTRITAAAGRQSRAHFPSRPAAALADRWNQKLTEFPGDHTGYWSRPDEFATALADALAH